MEIVIIKRICYTDKDIIEEINKKLNSYGVSILDNYGMFDYRDFKKQCLDTMDILHTNKKLNKDEEYLYFDFLGTIQRLVGVRNFNRFLSIEMSDSY